MEPSVSGLRGQRYDSEVQDALLVPACADPGGVHNGNEAMRIGLAICPFCDRPLTHNLFSYSCERCGLMWNMEDRLCGTGKDPVFWEVPERCLVVKEMMAKDRARRR